MADHDDLDPTLLARYLGGTASPAEVEGLRQWAGDDLARRNQLTALTRAWAQAGEVSAKVGPTPDVSLAWAGLAARTASTARSATARIPHARPRGVGSGGDRARAWSDSHTLGVAAALVLIAGGSLTIRHFTPSSLVQPVREFVTTPGSRATVVLRDGSLLVLGPATHVRVPADFGRTTRTIELDGEASLTVMHSEARPFVVRTDRGVIRDVGTTFVVRAYAGDADEHIAVSEGAVTVGGTSLRARDLAVIDHAGRVKVRTGIELAPYFAWVQGRLVFEDTPLREVARELERVFNLDVTIADSVVGSQRISGAFDTESADQVLDGVTDVVGARYERVGRRVVIRRRPVRASRELPPAPAPLNTAQAENSHP